MKERLLVVGNLAKDVIGGKEMYGGSAGNLAYGANQMDLDVSVLSVLGRDQFSSEYKEFLLGSGIDLSMTPALLDHLPVCVVSPNGNSWHDNGFFQAFSQLELETAKIDGFRIAHLICCPKKLARQFLARDIDISYEPGQMLVGNPHLFDEELARNSTFIFLNEDEFQTVSSTIISMLTAGLLSRLKALVVTLGDRGSAVYSLVDGVLQSDQYPAFSIPDQFIDPTGAGDAFKAGFFAGIFHGQSLAQSIRIGSIMGATAVSKKGGILKYQLNIQENILP